MKVIKADSPESILKCFDALHTLRPHLVKENFVGLITDMMKRGYILNYIEENGKVLCACGFRLTDHLAWDKPIYIDDLSTLPEARGKGYANAMLDYIFQFARDNGRTQIHLDSGAVPTRYDAHRLYIKRGFNITSHHFAIKLADS